MNIADKQIKNHMNESKSRRVVRILFGLITGNYLRRIRELEVIMQHWHTEEWLALERAQEAIACGNTERAQMWMSRSKEVRKQCEKEFRLPMIKLTGNPNLFDASFKSNL
jgi:hypothetical protein